MSFLPNYDIEARRKAKMKSAHRVITLRPIAGRIPKNSTTGDPIRFSFDGLYRDWETDRKSTRLNSSHSAKSRMPSSA